MIRREFLKALVVCSAAIALPIPALPRAITAADVAYEGPVVIKLLTDVGLNFRWEIPAVSMLAGQFTIVGTYQGRLEIFPSSIDFEAYDDLMIGMPTIEKPDGTVLGIVDSDEFSRFDDVFEGGPIPFVPMSESAFDSMEVW